MFTVCSPYVHGMFSRPNMSANLALNPTGIPLNPQKSAGKSGLGGALCCASPSTLRPFLEDKRRSCFGCDVDNSRQEFGVICLPCHLKWTRFRAESDVHRGPYLISRFFENLKTFAICSVQCFWSEGQEHPNSGLFIRKRHQTKNTS